MRPTNAEAAPGPGARARHWMGRQRLPAQMVLALGATTGMALLLVAALALWAPSAIAALGSAGGALALVLAFGSACAMAAAAVARRSAHGLLHLAAGARQLAREGLGDDLPLPQAGAHAELREASASLRRLVDAARAQRRALQARVNLLDQQLLHRTEELSSLQDLSTGLAGTTDLFELVDEALKALERTVDYGSASIWRREDGGGHQVVLAGYRGGSDEAEQPLRGKRLSRPNLLRYEQIERTGEPVVDNDARQSLLSWLWEMVTDDSSTSRLYRGTRAWMGVPLAFRDKVLAVLRVDHAEPGYFDAERVRLLHAVCSQTALAMHHAQLLLREREQAVVAERNRIARDLHDAVSQTLFASNVIAGTLAKQMAPAAATTDPARLQAQAQTLERLNRGALAEMRMLLFELRPDALDTQPLVQLLQHPIEALQCRGDMTVEHQIGHDGALSPAARVHVYRIAQEALSNIARHSGARHASLRWQSDAAGGGATLHIADDGEGFDPTLARPGHFGLDNLRSRAADIGATLVLRSAPGEGTELLLTLPTPTTAPRGPALP